MKGHRLGRVRQWTSMGGSITACECGKNFTTSGPDRKDVRRQHDEHLKELKSTSDIVWLGLDEDEVTLIEDVAHSFVKSGDPDRDKWQAIIRTIDQVRAGDWVKP